MKSRSLQLDRYTVHIFWSLATLVVVSMALYGYFVISTAFFLSDGKEVLTKVENLRSDLSVLEHRYITISDRIDLALASNMGFREDIDASNYIFRTNSVTALLSSGNGL